MGTTFRELLSHFGVIKTVDPVVNLAWENVLAREAAEGDRSPHGRPWHVSFHASQFPGDDRQACPRRAAYQMMDVDGRGVDSSSRWLNQTAEVGKAVELSQVRRVRDDGRLVRSADPTMSTDPDARDAAGDPMPQIGFVDTEHWLTGSVDMPIMRFNVDDMPHIVEVKTKHESQIEEMQLGLRPPNREHVKQLRCSLGMANDNPGAFLHPTEDRVLDVPTDGALYYLARDSKWSAVGNRVPTHEFLFEHDQAFMEAGYVHLRRWKQAFLDDELVQEQPRRSARTHPIRGWMWSKGICENCPVKKICRADFDAGVTRISESAAVAVARFSRTGYDDKRTRARVIEFWESEDKKGQNS